MSCMYINKKDEFNTNKHTFQNLHQHIEFIICQISGITNYKYLKNSSRLKTYM
jgi:hypothetical protein